MTQEPVTLAHAIGHIRPLSLALTGRCVLLLALALALLAPGLHLAHGQAPGTGPQGPTGRVSGRILGLKPGDSVQGAKVVLVKFTLDAQGTPQGQPIQMKEADASGGYAFDNVPIDGRSVYQLGTRIGGNLIPSESFTFPEGQRVVTLNLRVPEVVTDSTSLRIAQALIALEPQVGSVWVTDVVHLENPTKNVIDGTQTPIELQVPQNAENLEVIRQDPPQGTHQRLGNKLLIYGNLRPGISTIAVRYRMSVWLGGLKLEKSYPRSVAEMMVLVPAGQLKVTSDRLDARGRQTLEGQVYDSWTGANLASGAGVTIEASGVPMRQTWLLAPFALFFVIMGGVVFWYLRKRLAPASPSVPA